MTTKTERQWADDMKRWLLPYEVSGSQGITCPNTFVVAITQKDQADTQHTLHRKQGEHDYAFWDRTLDVASMLTVKVRTETPPTVYNRNQRNFRIKIRCCYKHISDTPSQDGRKAVERELWSIADSNNTNPELRVHALGLLAQLYGMI